MKIQSYLYSFGSGLQGLLAVGMLGAVGTLGALRTLLLSQEIEDIKEHVEELEANAKSLSAGFGNSESLVTMAAYVADNIQCCATNTATITDVQESITGSKESVSSICRSVRFINNAKRCWY